MTLQMDNKHAQLLQTSKNAHGAGAFCLMYKFQLKFGYCEDYNLVPYISDVCKQL